MMSSSISAALAGIQYERQQVDRAAHAIAAAGDPVAPVAGPSPASPPVNEVQMEIAVAMTTLLIAQRAFAAQLRVIEAADRMARESVRLADEDRPSPASPSSSA